MLGVGTGWSAPEFAAVGVPFAERGLITDEFLTVITRAWQEPTLSFEGEHVAFRDVATGPVPGSDRPPGVGTLLQIRDDLVVLDGLGADVVILDTNPDHPDQRRPAGDDRQSLLQIAAAVDDIVTRASG